MMIEPNQDNEKSRADFADRFVKSPVFIISYVAISLLCAILIYWVSGFVSPRELLFGFGAGLVLMVTIILTTGFIHHLRSDEVMNDRFGLIDKMMAAHNLNWIVNQNYIKAVEVHSSETWTFANELTFAIQPDSEISRGIDSNLAKGARYKFFMPDRPRVHKIVSDYKRIHKFAPGQVEFILIPHSEFLFPTILSLYNVRTGRPRCIEYLPIRKLNVWIEMDTEHSSRMEGIGEVLIRKYADRYTAPTIDHHLEEPAPPAE